ncbi:MAG TPA: AAA family ATPase [Candidatus Nitrosopolaris sp.]|nr:AAA family ATPase [Candidatus Nitrosopolaris sp.]
MSSDTIKEFVHRSYVSRPKYTEIMAGVPEDYSQIKTLGDLLGINYKHITVERQLRGNLITKLTNHEYPYPGIIGYNEDVIPAVNRAILAGHDILFVGQIGQAKTKIAECLAENLLSLVPVIQGSITNDIPTSIPEKQMVNILNDAEVVRTSPEFTVSKECEEIIRNNKLETKISWIEGSQRYRYILATPDISVKDLVGQIDAIKIAKKGVELYDIESYSSGQLLQARHGILCIDELPVLDPRKQVALLSVLQEGKFTTGSYPVVFKPDVKIMATANPVDYTHSGKIIEPLFDRLRSHVNTHYPRNTLDEMLIIIQEARIAEAGNVFLPVFMLRTIAKIMEKARTHHDINHDKGVSVRVAIHSTEMLVGEAERTRSISHFVMAIPRFSDVHSIRQSVKFELTDIEDTLEARTNVLNSIIDNALREVSSEYIQKLSAEQLTNLKNEFTKNKTFLVSQVTLGSNKSNSLDYVSQLESFPELKRVVNATILVIRDEQKKFIEIAEILGIMTETICIREDMNGEFTAAVTEVILEGLRWVKPPLLDRKVDSYGAIQ